MAMRINPTVQGYFNPDRVKYDDSTRVNRVEKVSPVQEVKGISSLTEQKAEEIDRESRGVLQTKVSPDNSFQKAMVSDASFAYERMAAKLMDKLPNILRDMKNLPETSDFSNVSDVVKQAEKITEASKKVVIGEDGRVSGEKAAAPETEDISL